MFVRQPSLRRLLPVAFLLALLWFSAFFAFGEIPLPGRPAQLQRVQSEFAAAPGINLELAELTPDRLAVALTNLDRAGIRWLRFTLPWSQLEPEQGQLDWTTWDAVFAALAAYPDLQPVVVLDGSPAWARAEADRDNPLAPPHERRDFGAFAAAVAGRYGQQIRYYQVWHEPNIAPHWGSRPADPADYMGLLREAAVQIRAADADAQIVLAALAPTAEAGGANLSDLSYLDALYSLGAQEWFDVVAAQPYGFSAAPDAPAAPADLNFGRARLLHEVMLRYGDVATPLWATAFGWNAPRDDRPSATSPWGQVTALAQADYARQAYQMAARQQPWLGPLFWAAYCPPRPADDPWLGFALCTAEGDWRPAWAVLAAAAVPEPILAPGLHGPDSPALRYSPGWRVTAEAADPSADGDLLDFSFYGAGVDLRVQGGPYWAFYRITVDGEPANALPRDETGAAYLVLHDPLAAARTVAVARDLPLREHAVRVVATGGWGQWALRGIAVAAAPARPVWPAWLLTGIAGLATLTWAGWLRRSRRAGPRSHTKGREGLARVDGGSPGSSAGMLSTLRRLLMDGPARLPETASWAIGIALAGLLILSRWAPLDLAALAGLGWLFLVRPDLSLPFIAAALPFWQRPKQILGWEFGHFELFLWVAAAALALRWGLQFIGGGSLSCHKTKDEGRRTKGQGRSAIWDSLAGLDWPILALFLSGLASTLAAAGQGVAWREFRIVFLFGAVFYALITRVPWPEGRPFSWRPLVAGLLAGMAAASLIGLGQLVTGQGRIDVEGVWRVRALYGSPNNLALLLDRGVPLALALAAFGALTPTSVHTGLNRSSAQGESFSRDRRPEDSSGLSPLRMTHEKGFGYGARVLCAVAAMLLLIACIATFSKGALLLGLPAGIAVVLLGGARRSGRRWPLWALAGLVVLAAVGLALLFRTPRFADLFNFQSGTSFVRIKLWQAAWRMALDHPILGVGPDNFLYAYRTHYVLPSAWQELNLSHPHNILLDLWTRLGLIGGAAGGWALVATLRAAWRSFRAGNAGVWPLALGLLAGLAATVAHGLIDNSLFLPDLMGLFVVAAGVLQRTVGEG